MLTYVTMKPGTHCLLYALVLFDSIHCQTDLRKLKLIITYIGQMSNMLDIKTNKFKVTRRGYR